MLAYTMNSNTSFPVLARKCGPFIETDGGEAFVTFEVCGLNQAYLRRRPAE